MDTVMIAWVVGVPMALFFMVLVLARLEALLIAPMDRAARITSFIDHDDPDDLEQHVSLLLAPVAGPRDWSSTRAG